MFWWLFLAIIGTLAAGVVLSAAGAYFWKKFNLRSTLADWLHSHHLEKSQLMNAFIKIDGYFSGFLRLYVTEKGYLTPQLVSTEEYITISDLPDNVRKQVERIREERGEYQEMILQN